MAHAAVPPRGAARLLLAVAVLGLASGVGHAQTLTWSGTSDNWNTTDVNWNSGGFSTAWTNGSSAAFNNVGVRTVNLSPSLSGNALLFSTGGIQSGTNNLTLSGSSLSLASITVNGQALGGNVDSIAQADSQRLTLNDANVTVSGNVTVQRGSLLVSGSTNLNITGTLRTPDAWSHFVMSGGTVTASGGVDFKTIASGMDFNGGTLITSSIWGNSFNNEEAIATFNGTKVVATQNNADFFKMSSAGGGQAHAAPGRLKNAGLVFDTNGFGVTIANQLSDSAGNAGTLTKLGSGTLSLTVANNYTGKTSINAGTLNAGVAQNGTSSGALGANGNIEFGGGALQFSAATAGWDPSSRIAAGTSGGAVRIDTNSQNVTFGTGLTSSQSGGLTKTGAGTLTLTAANAYTGATSIDAGTVRIASTVSLAVSDSSFESPVVATNGDVRALNNGGVGNNTPWTPAGSSWTFENNAGIGNGTGGGFNVAQPVPSGSQYGLMQSFGNVAPRIYQTLSFPTAGSYTLNLRSVGAVAGGGTGVTVSVGGTSVGSFTPASNASWGSNSVVFNVATPGSYQLKFEMAATNSNFASMIDQISLSTLGAGTNSLPVGTALTVASSGTFDLFGGAQTLGSLADGAGGGGSVTNNGATSSTLTLNSSSGSTTFGGVIGGGSGAISLVKSGVGTQVLSGINTYTGATTVSAGQLQIGAGGTAGSLASAAVSVASGGTIAFNRSDAITYGGTISGSGGLTKAGAGTLSLTGANLYTGTTNIDAGTLAVSGSLASSAVNVAGLATLSGTGTLNAVTVADGGLLAPGSSGIGTLRLSSLVFSGSSTVTMGVQSFAPSSLLQVNGGLTLGGGANSVTFAFGSNLGSINSGTYSLLSYTGSQLADASAFTVSGATGARQSVAIANGSQAVNLVIGNAFPIWSGTAGSGWSTADDWVLNTTGSSTSFLANDAVLFDDTAATGNVTLSQGVNPISTTFSGTTLAYSLSSSGGFGITAGSLVKSGPAVLTISTSNSYSDGTTLSAGTLRIGDNAALGTGVVTVTGGTISSDGGSARTLANAFAFNGNTTLGSGVDTGVLTLSGTLDLGGATRTLTTPSDVTFAGVVVNGGLTKSGTGTLSLTAANSYTGATTVSAGTLQVGAGGTTGSLASTDVSVAAGAAVAFNRSDAVTMSGSISGAGSLTKLGGNTLTLSAANTYTGATTVSAGTLQVGDGGTNGSIASTDVGVAAGAVLAFNRSDAISYGGTVSGAGGLTKLGGNTLTLTAANTYPGATTVSTGTLQVGAGGTAGSLGSTDVSVASGAALAFNRSDASTMAGTISGAGSVRNTGAGTLTLSGSNSYSGATTISAGSVRLGAAAGIPDNTPLSVSGGTLDLGGFSKSFTQTATFTSGTVTNSGGTAATISLSATGSNMTIASLIQNGTSPVGFAVASSGTGASARNFDFTNPGNTFSGGVTVNNASARMVGTGAKAAMGTGPITVSGSGYVMLWTNDGAYAGTTTIANNWVLNTLGGNLSAGYKTAIFSDGSIGGSANTLLTGTVTLASDGGVDGFGNNNLTIQGQITGAGALYKGIAGSGQAGNIVTLSNAANDYAGGTVVNNGTLRQGAANVIPSGAGKGDLNIVAGTFDLGGYASSVNGLSGAGTITNSGTSGSNVLSVGSNNATTTYAGVIQNGGSATTGLTKTGAGRLTLTGANTYTGATTVSTGTLQIGAGGTAGSLGATAVSVASGALLAFNRSDAITYGGTISGAGGLTKAGAGTLTLTAANTYTGATNIDAGTVKLQSSFGVTVLNNSFESPARGTGFYENTTPTDWTRTGLGGISSGNSTVYNPTGTQPAGTQNAFTKDTGGSLSQTINLPSNSTYTISFYAVGRAGFSTPFTVSLGGTALNTYTPSTSAWTLYTETVTRPAGNYALSFANASAGDFSVNFDDVVVTGASGGTNLLPTSTAVAISSAATLDLFGGAQTIASLTDGAGGGGSVTNTDTTAGTLTLNPSSGSSTFSGVIGGGSGPISLVKNGAGTQILTGINTYTGATTISAGQLQIGEGGTAGSLASTAVSVASGATLAGAGSIAGSVGGDGFIAPGNSPGILAIGGQFQPTASTGFAFEFLALGEPDYSAPTASINDVLRVSGTTPFSSSLASTNVVNVYLDVTSIAENDTFIGGFFTDADSGSFDLSSAVVPATYEYFVTGDGGGNVTYNNVTYYTLADYITQFGAGITGVTASVITVPIAAFADGTVLNGQMTQFIVVPEPGQLALVATGLVAAVGLLGRGRKGLKRRNQA